MTLFSKIISSVPLFVDSLAAEEKRILVHIRDCKTEAMGMNDLSCTSCDYKEIHYNSCRDRHCPICQGVQRAKWVSSRLKELLPARYFHCVFTIPKELRELAYWNKSVFFRTFFMTVHSTLEAVSLNSSNLGARIGGLSIIHTWDQRLNFHPHIHCIIPGGGISADGLSWVSSENKFLLPVRKLSIVFRAKLLKSLESLYKKKAFNLFGKLDYLSVPSSFKSLLVDVAKKGFNVYCKLPFGGPAQVLKYLGRYTHRVGISEQRIVNFSDDKVAFSWTDRKDYSRKVITLSTTDFLKRFLFHRLPRGFWKVRYFGFMSNKNRASKLDKTRRMIEAAIPLNEKKLEPASVDSELSKHARIDYYICPVCGGRLAFRLPSTTPVISLTGTEIPDTC